MVYTKRGTWRASGSVYALPTSGLLISETESSSSRTDPRSAEARTLPMWATPDAAVMNDGQSVDVMLARKESRGGHGTSASHEGGTDLVNATRDWPTPTARDEKGPFLNHRQGGRDLSMEVDRSSWPTPTAGDAKSSGSRIGNPDTAAKPGTSLTDATGRFKTTGKLLNADWVETLQLFPPGWTRLPKIAG